ARGTRLRWRRYTQSRRRIRPPHDGGCRRQGTIAGGSGPPRGRPLDSSMVAASSRKET
ncbi:unnamed protein product, partial [Musa textilis]